MTRHEKGGSRREPPLNPKAARRDGTVARDEGRTDSQGRQRIAKLMARAGLCSRRDAEAWIVDDRVSVNGDVLTSPAIDVGPQDTILVDGTPLPAAEKTRLFLFHKPRGLVTSDRDPEGRATVADFLRETWPDRPRVVTVGRLDINTEGLLLLTNDGGLARVLELPRTGWMRRYRVRAKGKTDQGVLDRLREGVRIDGVDYAGIEAKLDRIQGANCWLTMGLREGKNREIKRVLEHIGLEVNRLIRLSFGPFQLLDLPEGAVEEVRTRILRDQLGDSLAAAAGADFHDADAAPASAPAERQPTEAKERRASRRTDNTPARPARDRPATQEGRAPRRDNSTRRPDERRQTTDGRKRSPRERSGTEAPARRDRPVVGTRKHVSMLRADEAVALRKGPRKRVERADTKDRRNRTVTVERLVAPRDGAAEPTHSRRGAGRFAAGNPAEERSRVPKRGHASPSTIAKRERISRSGVDADAGRRRAGSRDDRDRDNRSGGGSGAPKPRIVRLSPRGDDRRRSNGLPRPAPKARTDSFDGANRGGEKRSRGKKFGEISSAREERGAGKRLRPAAGKPPRTRSPTRVGASGGDRGSKGQRRGDSRGAKSPSRGPRPAKPKR